VPGQPLPALRFLLLVLAYVAGAWLSAYLVHGPDQVVLVWLPSGITLAALVLYGRRYWPFIPLAETLYQALPPAAEPAFIAFTAAANTLAALAAAGLVRRFRGVDHDRFVIRTGYLLLAAALLLATLSALIGVSGLLLVGYIAPDSLEAALVKWVVANLFGVVLVAPATLLLARSLAAGQRERDSGLGSHREWLAWLLGLLLVSTVLVQAEHADSPFLLGLGALPFALLLWSALRFSPLTTALAVLLVGLGLTLLAGLGLGGFPRPQSLFDAVALLTFLSLVALVPLLLSAAANENRLAAHRLLHKARTDELTGLANRAGFEAAARARLTEPGQGLLYVDLDSFKLVNDTAGHAAGDRLVQSLAGLLRAELRPADLLARIGGDEFAVLLAQRSRGELDALARRLCAVIADYRFAHDGHVFALTASIGALRCEGEDYGAALAQVDAACFTAKELGGNRVQWAAGAGAVEERTSAMRWASRITEAIERGRFQLYCQSIEPLSTAAAEGRHFEVLLRLREASGELLLPGPFVAAAERFRLGTSLDRHVLARTLGWLEAHPEAAAQTRCCSINLCAASVGDPEFLAFLQARLAASPVRASTLCFEITESSAVRDLGEARRFIDGVRALGCRLALDDFGSGFCSFGYLEALDVDYLKIDGSFVRRCGDSELALSIVKAIAEIARSIHKQSIAESVEDEAIRRRLRQLAVDHAQGYAIDRPIPIDDYFAATRP
jgi:diguanylate cyclase (GGDEF)-like protein